VFKRQGKIAFLSEDLMKKYFITAAVIVGFSAPALADQVYVMLEMSSKKCVTMATKPSDMSKYKMLGEYPTLGEAKTAMLTMTECK